MSSPLPRRAFRALVRRLAEARRRSPDGEVVSGHHNANAVRPLGRPLALVLGEPSGRVLAKFRTPLPAVEVVPRIWPRESEVLRAVRTRVDRVPRCLADFGEWSLHEYFPGTPIAQVAPAGSRLGRAWTAELAGFLAEVALVRKDDLPPLPADWPDDGDSQGFLRWLARFAEQKVHRANRPRFGVLFDEVGIPADAVERFVNSAFPLSRRPFKLLHTDVHRSNVVVVPARNGERLVVIDWELALYGDPLHDLATHLVRMDYDKDESAMMVDLWAAAMRRTGQADCLTDLHRDLATYRDFEYVQSLFPDVMRAALYLPDRPDDRDLDEAAGRIRRALHRAWRPLALTGQPLGEDGVRAALRRWHAADGEWRVRTTAVREDGGRPQPAGIARMPETRRWRAYRSRPTRDERERTAGVPG